jgi:choline dehydrogenase-like flavoprotein
MGAAKLEADVVVLGAGLSGLLLAAELSRSHKVVVVEKEKLKQQQEKYWVTPSDVPCDPLSEPDHIFVAPLLTLNELQREHFETPPDTGVWPEVGSRAMQRLVVVDEAYSKGWVFVQEKRYRYVAIGDRSVMVRGVFSEYLAYEVIWDR